MASILDLIRDREERRFQPGELVVSQGGRTNSLYVLVEGTVEVLKDDMPVATASMPGSVFGEMSALLGGDHTATVRAVVPCRFYIVGNAREFLRDSPTICLHVCELLARRLDALNRYLVDVKRQYVGHDHLSMVDDVLDALMHRQPKERVRPRESTIRDGELTD